MVYLLYRGFHKHLPTPPAFALRNLFHTMLPSSLSQKQIYRSTSQVVLAISNIDLPPSLGQHNTATVNMDRRSCAMTSIAQNTKIQPLHLLETDVISEINTLLDG